VLLVGSAAPGETDEITSNAAEENTLMKRSHFCWRQQLLSQTASLMSVAVIALIVPPLAYAQSTLVVDDDGQATATNCNAGTPAFNSIQAAVNAAAPGNTIFICPGTYDEQVEVTTSDLTILGAGASLTILRPSFVSPSTPSLTSGAPMRPILLVDHAAGVTVSDLKIDGSIADGGAPAVAAICNFPALGAYVGIYYRNSSGKVEATHVTNMRSATVCTRGFFGQSNVAGASEVVLNGNLFDSYGEVGLTCTGLNTNCTVTGNTVRGRGPVDDEIQSGIQVRLATATISGNVITDHYFLPLRLEGSGGGSAAIAVGIFLVAVDPDTHPHILRDNIFADNELDVQRVH
jgi:hypothetical protein